MAVITDIHALDFNYILRYLWLMNLCDFGNSNSELMVAAHFEFSRRYRRKFIRFCLNKDGNGYIDENDQTVTVYGLRYSLVVLRCFGHLIENLELDISGSDKYCEDKFWIYLNRYCSDTLINLRLYQVEFDLFLNFEKVFEKMHKIEFFRCDFYNHLYNINFIFPNLKDIAVNGWNLLIYKSIITGQPLNESLTEDNLIEFIQYRSNDISRSDDGKNLKRKRENLNDDKETKRKRLTDF